MDAAFRRLPPRLVHYSGDGSSGLNDAGTDRRAAIRSAILSYLEKHPRASDALAGICAWWLREAGVTGPAADVEEVLEALVAQQLIRRVRLADGTVLYCGRDVDRG